VKREKLIDLDLDANGGRVALYSSEEVEAWIAKEQEFWRWFEGYQNREGNLAAVWSRVWSPLSNMANIAYALRQNGWSNAEQKQQLSQTILQTYKSTDFVLHSTSTKAQLVDDLRQSDPLAAAYALAVLVNNAIQPASASAFRGIVEATLFEKGIKGNAKPEKKALEDALIAFQKDSARRSDEADKLNNALSESLDTFSGSTQLNRDEFAKLVATSQGAIDAMLSGTKTELDNITKTYDEKLALQAPVRYWSTKRRFHRIAREKIGSGLRWGGIGSAIVVALSVWLLLGDSSTKNPPEYWRIGLIVIFLTIVFWSIRLGIKIFLSHLHLEEDAAQRITMIQTYLSLMRRGQTNSAEDFKQILSALFRPTGDGLVKDEGMPTSALDYFTRPSK
jgi:Family of unknown function (DUF6161)